MTLSLCIPRCLFLLLSVSLFLSSLLHFRGFTHPNPYGLLTRPNTFHSHLTSLFAFISFLSSFLCFFSLGLLVSTFTFPFLLPVCFLRAPSLPETRQIHSHEHSSLSWQRCWQAEFLSLKLSSCRRSAQVYPGRASSGCPFPLYLSS